MNHLAFASSHPWIATAFVLLLVYAALALGRHLVAGAFASLAATRARHLRAARRNCTRDDDGPFFVTRG